MQRLVLAMIVGILVIPALGIGDLLGQFRILPAQVALLPEAISLVALLAIVVHGLRSSFRQVPAAYALVLSALLLSAIAGAIANQVATGPVLAGFRLYARAIPWLFVPLVYSFSEAQLRTQLSVLMWLLLLQTPIAIEQRIKTADSFYGYVAVTGDMTTGTLGDSGILSIVLISAACVILALYERRHLQLSAFLALFVVLLLPTTINETKATVFFLPVGLMTAILVASRSGERMRKLVFGFLLIAVFGAAFIPIYDRMNEGREYGTSIEDFFSNSESIKTYLGADSSSDSADIPGRVDAITIPLATLAQDPVSLAFGYGIGNATQSNLGPAFSGVHSFRWRYFLQSTMVRTLLELGVLGVTLFLVMLALVFRDALFVARHNNSLTGAIAAGWTGVIALLALAMGYVLLEAFPPVTYLFWYFSGLIASERMRITTAGQPNAARQT